MGGRRNLGKEDGIGKREKEWAATTGTGDNGEDAILEVSEENPTRVNRGNPLICCPIAHLCTASHVTPVY